MPALINPDSPRLVLASASPRRAELLRAAGFVFVVRPADVDESVRQGETPHEYVLRLAVEKAHAARRAPGEVVLAADTTVVVDDEIFGKPADELDAMRMLRKLSGRSHEVLTGVCVTSDAGQQALVAVTEVEFVAMSSEEVAWYVSSGEPMDKAGAYGIQGLCSRFIARVNGSYPNVVGLPVSLADGMLRRAGMRLPRAQPHLE